MTVVMVQGGDYRRFSCGGGGLPGRQRDSHLPPQRDGEGGEVYPYNSVLYTVYDSVQLPVYSKQYIRKRDTDY